MNFSLPHYFFLIALFCPVIVNKVKQSMTPEDMDRRGLRPRDDEVGTTTVGCHCEERSDAAIQEARGHGLPRYARSDEK